MEHKLRVSRRVIWIPNNDNMIALGVRADTIRVEFDSEWDGMDWVVVHFSAGSRYHRAVMDGDVIAVPWEVLLDEGILYVTFVGYVGLEVRVTTEQMSRPYFINPSGPALLESPLGSSPDDMQYFLSIARDCASAEEVRAKAEEQRRTNELVRIANEERRKRADAVMQDRIGLIATAIQTLGALHSEVDYLYLATVLHDNHAQDAYDAASSCIAIEGSSAEGASLLMGGDLVGLP